MRLPPRGEGIAASGGGLALLVCAVAAGMALQCALLAGRATATPRPTPLTAQRERAVWPVRSPQASAPIEHTVVSADVVSTDVVAPAVVRSAPARVARPDAGASAQAMPEMPARTTHAASTAAAPESTKVEGSGEPAAGKKEPVGVPAPAGKPVAAHAEPAAAEAETSEGLVTAMGTPISTPGLMPTEQEVHDALQEIPRGGGAAFDPDPEDGTTADGDSGGTQVVVIGPARGRVGEQITFQIGLEGATDVAHAPLRVDFDPAVLQFAGAQEGLAFSRDGAATQFLAAPESSGGRVDIALSRMPPARGLDGGGALCTLTFTAIGAGTSPIVISRGRLMDTMGRAVSFRRSDAHVSIE